MAPTRIALVCLGLVHGACAIDFDTRPVPPPQPPDGTTDGDVQPDAPVDTVVTDTHEVFGSPLPESGEMLGVGELIGNADSYLGTDVLVETRIAKVCQKKGCFFIVQHGADTVRVTFQDYGFFIPTDAGGKTVTLAGTFSRKPLSREKAEHLAEDLGEEAPKEVPGFEYTIVATAVSIPKA